MIIRIKNFLKKYYLRVTKSIAFYPSLIAFLLTLLAIGMLVAESFGISQFITDHFSFIVIDNSDTARGILTTLIAGVMSLMVFSFSMVMIVLNQAANNFTQRLLPELISNRQHQIVLGFYLGTILYSILIMINILPDTGNYDVPGTAVLIAIVLGILSLIFFIYFINTISTNIQISNILYKLYINTKAQYSKQEKADDFANELPASSNAKWKSLNIKKSGYLQSVDFESLNAIAREHQIRVYINVPVGLFVHRHSPVIQVHPMPADEVRDKIVNTFTVSEQEWFDGQPLNGIKQMTEVILKAMSPGINDPGTALNAIDYLSDLLALEIEKKPFTSYNPDSEKSPLVFITPIPVSQVLHITLGAIRQYAKHDIVITLRLIKMLASFLQHYDFRESKKNDIEGQLHSLMFDADENIKNPLDRKAINELLNQYELATYKIGIEKSNFF